MAKTEPNQSEPGFLLLDVLRAWDSIHEKTSGKKKDEFFAAKRLPGQIQKQLEIISERLSALPPELVKRYSHIEIPSLLLEVDAAVATPASDPKKIEQFWKLCKSTLPSLEEKIELMYREVGRKAHPLRVCPIGSHWVREHPRDVNPSEKNPAGITVVDGHCRRNRTNRYRDELSPSEMKRLSEQFAKNKVRIGNFKNTKYSSEEFYQHDALIEGWTRYWNEVFKSEVPLNVEVAKALLGSESSFKARPKDQKTKNEGWARGAFQLTDATRKTLKNYKGELKDYYLDVDEKDVYEPDVAVSAAIRWLFYKKSYGEHFLKRDISWEESVGVYKGLIGLVKKKAHEKHTEFKPFRRLLNQIRGDQE